MKNLTEKEAEDFLEKRGFKVVQRILINNLDEYLFQIIYGKISLQE